MGEVPYVDQSGLYALEDALLTYASNGTEVLIIGLQDAVRMRMEGIRMIPGLVSDDQIIDKVEDLVDLV